MMINSVPIINHCVYCNFNNYKVENKNIINEQLFWGHLKLIYILIEYRIEPICILIMLKAFDL